MRVALVHFSRRLSGETRRLQAWSDVLIAGGHRPVEVSVFGVRRVPSPHHLRQVLASAMPPETLAWNVEDVVARTQLSRPDVIVCLNARAFAPGLADVGPVILDWVDRLSVSYDQRRQIERGLASKRFTVLRWSMQRVEARPPPGVAATVAAGRVDALALGAEWFPIPVQVVPADIEAPPSKPWDVVFFGSLDYPPNVAAVEWLADRVVPAIRGPLPALTWCVAGRRPTGAVRRAVTRGGGVLVEDFADVEWLAIRSIVAVAPMHHATGIQIKVLEAAANGLPVVMTPRVADGLDEGFPAIVASEPESFAQAVVELVSNPSAARAAGMSGQAHVREHYSVEAWARWADGLLRRVTGS